MGKVCEWNEVTSWERWEVSEQGRWDGMSGQNYVVLLQGSEV